MPKSMPKSKSLADLALVVRLTVSRWEPTRTDPRGSEIVAQATNGNGESGLYRKFLIDPKEVKPIATIAHSARGYNYDHTLPWEQGGYRLLPVKLFPEWSARVGEYRQQFDSAVRAFLNVFPTLKGQAQMHLGTLYDESEYPTREELARAYSFGISVSPVEDRPTLSPHLAELIEAQTAAQLHASMNDDRDQSTQAAHRDLWKRALDVAGRLADTLGQEDKIFRDSMIRESIKALRGIEALDIFDVPELADVRRSLESLVVDTRTAQPINPDIYRTDPDARKTAAKTAEEKRQQVAAILGKFGG